ncbi:MAG: ribosome maturation factor RimP [Nitriliruptorales bacterium]|nr:ribosome maturation factor RimP [Nitriliruptorales bacterium]
MGTDVDELRDAVTGLAAVVAERANVDLEEVEVRGAHGSRVVRIVADRDDGLDVERIAAISQELGEALDREDLIDGAYTLEVTSPGVDRPLRDPKSFRRNVGRPVRVVRNRAAIDRGEKGEVTGTLQVVTDDAVVLEVDGDEREIAFADVDHGKVVLPW